MTRFYRLPALYIAITLGLTLTSYAVFAPDQSNQAASTSIEVSVQSQEEKAQERKKLVAFIAERYSKPQSVVSKIVDEANVQARSKGIDPLLFLALIGVESSFNPNALSSKGAVGLSQVLPTAHPEKIKAVRRAGGSPSGIKENIRMGVSILAEYRKLHNGNMRLALLRYNGSLKDPRGRYAAKVMATHARLETIADRKAIRAVSAVAAP